MNRASTRQVEVSALLLRRTDYGESDLVLQVLTDKLGRISVMARAARASKRRFSGGIEPFHGLLLHLDEPQSGELYRLRETRLARPRLRLAGDLIALGVAGRALGWVRDATAANLPERATFDICAEFLDQLDTMPTLNQTRGQAVLSLFGLALLRTLGWALELERCVRCGRDCPIERSCTIAPHHGGIVCQRCGGGRYMVSGRLRQTMRQATSEEPLDLADGDSLTMLDIVEATLRAHPGLQIP